MIYAEIKIVRYICFVVVFSLFVSGNVVVVYYNPKEHKIILYTYGMKETKNEVYRSYTVPEKFLLFFICSIFKW